MSSTTSTSRGQGTARGHTNTGSRGRGGRGRGNIRGGRPAGIPSYLSRKPKKRDFQDGLDNTPLGTIPIPAVEEGRVVRVSDVIYIGSYNWIDADIPTLIVPGSPRVWQDRGLPFSVERDSGIHVIDNNGLRMPSSPLLPLFRAVDVVAKSKKDVIDWPSVDFVTDRNNLRKLLRWITGTGQKKEFRIDMQLAGKRTVLFNRWEQLNTCYAGEGYGYNFEAASTAPEKGCERGTCHNRIVKYDLNGLTLIVRFEVDACLSKPNDPSGTGLNGVVDELSNQLADLSVAPPMSPETATPGSPIVVIGGKEVPQEVIVELKTRADGKVKWAETYPQLFLSQTPHIFLATHTRGTFTEVTEKELGSPSMMDMGVGFQSRFWRLKVALEAIQELAVLHGKDARLSLVGQKGELKIYRRKDSRSCLPDDVLERFYT